MDRPTPTSFSLGRASQVPRPRVGIPTRMVLNAVFASVAVAATVAGLSEGAPRSAARGTAAAAEAVQPALTVLGPRVELLDDESAQEPTVTPPPELSLPLPAEPTVAAATACPSGMVEVRGEYCPSVLHRCIRWINERRDRCAEYEPTSKCFGEPVPKHFCIDQYEYPNQPGAMPHVGMTWERAKAKCEADSKRLCTSSEWTLACEGPELTPYPDGYTRGTCNQDRPYIFPDNAAFRNPATRPREIERLRQSHPSGARLGCVSHYGAFDMTGNVDEWVVNEQGSRLDRPYDSGLKGGYWGPVRNRCRPMTVDHNAWHAGYQIGFRCCADLPESG